MPFFEQQVQKEWPPDSCGDNTELQFDGTRQPLYDDIGAEQKDSTARQPDQQPASRLGPNHATQYMGHYETNNPDTAAHRYGSAGATADAQDNQPRMTAQSNAQALRRVFTQAQRIKKSA